MGTVRLLAGGWLLAVGWSAATQVVDKRAALTRVSLAKAQVTYAVLMPAGVGTKSGRLAAATLARLPAFCEVWGTDRTSDDSQILTKAWLPVSRGTSTIPRWRSPSSMATPRPRRIHVTSVTKRPSRLGIRRRVVDFGWRAASFLLRSASKKRQSKETRAWNTANLDGRD